MADGELGTVPERLIGASCTLGAPELRERLREWRELRDRAQLVESIGDGIRLSLRSDEPMGPVADLVARESDCCAFYTFTLQVEGPRRALDMSAGPGGAPALRALLGYEG